jgi:hypothetical protein
MADKEGGGQKRESGGRDGLTRRERSMLREVVQFLGFADLMAVLMVAATAFSGYATWRTAGIAQALYRASERPYLGVQRVWMDRTAPQGVRVAVEYRNYGHVPAENTDIAERLLVDGHPVLSAKRELAAGIISPGVPHFLHVHLDDTTREAVKSGKSSLIAIVAASYNSAAGHKLCYLERFKYLPELDWFDADGGSPRCRDQQRLEARP